MSLQTNDSNFNIQIMIKAAVLMIVALFGVTQGRFLCTRSKEINPRDHSFDKVEYDLTAGKIEVVRERVGIHWDLLKDD